MSPRSCVGYGRVGRRPSWISRVAVRALEVPTVEKQTRLGQATAISATCNVPSYVIG